MKLLFFIVFLVSSKSLARDNSLDIKNINKRIESSQYEFGRSFSDYVDLLSPSQATLQNRRPFYDVACSLGTQQRWLDVGAGAGVAITDYFLRPIQDHRGKKTLYQCSGYQYAEVVGITVEDQKNEHMKQIISSIGSKIKFFTGKYFEDFLPEELGTFDLISDVYGAVAYSPKLDVVLRKAGNLLRANGYFMTLLEPKEDRRTNNPDKKEIYEDKGSLQIFSRQNQYITLNDWFGNFRCLKLIEPINEDRPVIILKKVCDDVYVPDLILEKIFDGSPPVRQYISY